MQGTFLDSAVQWKSLLASSNGTSNRAVESCLILSLCRVGGSGQEVASRTFGRVVPNQGRIRCGFHF
ncbi:unnamed protein product [Lathyrus sativus]|nr:unnamed protein product [Lathyrus sativus]